MRKFKKFAVALMLTASIGTGAYAKVNVPKIKLVHEDGSKSFEKKLTHRKGTILVTWATGIVTKGNGWGKIDGYAEGHNDIKYSRNTHKGDKILSIMVYNPDNNHQDDVVERCDFVIDCGHKKGK